MAEIKLAYDPKNKIAKKTLRYILSLGVFEEIPKKSVIEISLEEAKSRTINTYKKVSDTFDKIGR
jgi:RsiW-degrading membrane proteinase PrsW (M82 family)